MFKLKVLSCQEVKGKSKKTGNDFVMYQLYFMMGDGSIAKFTSFSKAYKPGEEVTFTLATGYDGTLSLRIAD